MPTKLAGCGLLVSYIDIHARSSFTRASLQNNWSTLRYINFQAISLNFQRQHFNDSQVQLNLAKMSSLAAPRPTLSPEQQATRDAETNLPFILGITMTCHALALTTVCLRMYVRKFIVKVVGLDDYTMIAAMVRLKS